MKSSIFSMKKVVILFTIFLISCGSDGENSSPVSSDEMNNDVFESRNLYEIYECLDLVTPCRFRNTSKFDGGYDEAV